MRLSLIRAEVMRLQVEMRNSEGVNKSSSFYSEGYYQKKLKEAQIRKPNYREANQEHYDQEHELDILHFYLNHSGRCEMIRYYEMIAELFFVVKEKHIKGSDEYNDTVKEFLANANLRIRYFHEYLMCNQFETREQRQKRLEEQMQNSKVQIFED